MIRTYTELMNFTTFKERYEYLRLDGIVGKDTFGFDRYLNQKFYHSQEWRRVRDFVILRDNGCDLGVEGFDIFSRAVIHHMNPILTDDIIHCTDILLNPEYLITTTHDTHNAIHYGDENLLQKPLIERRPGDTCPWKR